MFIPLGTDRTLRRTPHVTRTLIVLILVSFLFQLVSRDGSERAGLDGLVLAPGRSAWYTYLTYAFLHGGLLHIAGNLLFLWVFGPNVEDRLGRVGFAGFYAVGAIAAGVIHAWFEKNPVVGASGAIAAVTGAYIVLFPLTRVRTLLIFFIIGVYLVPSWFFVGLAVARDLLGFGFGGGAVAYAAHLGGYAYGAGIALVLLGTGLLDREQYDLFNLMKQSKRRRAFRAAGRTADRRVGRVAAEGRARGRGRDQVRGEGGSVDSGGAVVSGADDASVDAEEPERVESDEAASARAAVSGLISEDRLDEAAGAYARLVSEHPLSATLSRDMQYRLATHLVEMGRPAEAARAFERFLDAYPRDREAGQIRLLLGRLYARQLGDTARAIPLLKAALSALEEGELREMARHELAGIQGSPGGGGA